MTTAQIITLLLLCFFMSPPVESREIERPKVSFTCSAGTYIWEVKCVPAHIDPFVAEWFVYGNNDCGPELDHDRAWGISPVWLNRGKGPFAVLLRPTSFSGDLLARPVIQHYREVVVGGSLTYVRTD